MPSPALSPQQNLNMVAMPTSPRQSSGGDSRPPIMKRHSSQSSHGGSRQVTSPGSAGEHHPLRQAVGGRQRHTKIVLPRNHSSQGNLAKMGKQAVAGQHVQYADDGKRHARQRSHEGDSEIRLPGSLDENKPQLRRNMTAHDLSRNKSGTKLKKNLSHGQLTRLSSGKNLVNMALTQKAPPSPGLKGRKVRAKSEEVAPRERDLHEQEVELHRQQQERKASQEAGAPRKVGFAVGSAGDDSDEEEMTQMEGSGLQEDEWTEDSASASPLSTRLNTANNSRRPSVATDKPPDKAAGKPQHPIINFHMTEMKPSKQPDEQPRQTTPEADGTLAPSEEDEVEDEQDDVEEDEAEMPSPKSMPSAPVLSQEVAPLEPAQSQARAQEQPPPPPHARSPLHAAKEHPNPVAERLTSAQLPAPALVSSVSALDDVHSMRGSPAPSLRSARSITGNDGAADREQEQELVSRFLPSTSHPSTGSGGNTGSMNTPKMGSFQCHTPEKDSTLHHAKAAGATFHTGPVSPASTRSASSGATTPALGRSRIELKMMHDKALADREAAAERQPLVPHHIYDRRNETLKSYLNLVALGETRSGISASMGLSLGPEIFQGRFKAVNTELKVVQKFRDPIAETVRRLQKCRGTKLGERASPQKQQAAALKMSKSAVTLPSRVKPISEPSKLSTSASPPKATPPTGAQAKSDSLQKPLALQSSKRALQMQQGEQRGPPKRGVSFAGSEPETRECESGDEEVGPDAIARILWDSVGV